MACTFSFDGGNTYISKEQFIEDLAKGKFDEFIKDGSIKLSDIKGTGKPPIEPPKTIQLENEEKRKSIGISKAALKEQYNFSEEFDKRGGEEAAVSVLTTLNDRAKQNNISLEKQLENEVDLMSKTNPDANEHNVITAGSYLLNIDKALEIAIQNKDLDTIEVLTKEREKISSVLRNLGNKAGRTLNLFNLVFNDVSAKEIKVTIKYLKKIFDISKEIPETISQLEKSDLTSNQKDLIRPFVEKIEKIKKEYDEIDAEIKKRTNVINDAEVAKAIENARVEAKKEGYEEGLKANTKEGKQKKSKQLKDLASKIRSSDEFDKFLGGAKGQIQKQSIIDLGSYKEMAANVLEAVAKAVEIGENINDAIKKAIDKFKDIDKEQLAKDVKTLISKMSLPNKNESIEDIKLLSENEKATTITDSMVNNGLIKNIVDSYLGEEGLTHNQIMENVVNDLKDILPDITKEDVSDAYVRRNKFQQESKEKIEDSIKQKKEEIKAISIKEARLRALEAADDFYNEKTEEGKKRIKSAYEKELDEKIKKLNDEKKNIISSNKTEQDKIDEINKEIEFVKKEKEVFNQNIKDSKKASEALIKAREERDKVYSQHGLKLEKNSKKPILVEREYQKALEEIDNNNNLSEQEKNDKKQELKAQRDLDLQGTKQGVISSLSDDIKDILNEYTKKENDSVLNKNKESEDYYKNVKNIFTDILNILKPTGEKLDDIINKAYDKLNNLSENKNLTKEDLDIINNLKNSIENNNQLASDEISAKRLEKQWKNEIKKAETDIASGNFTKLKSNVFDFRRNEELVKLNKARKNKTGQLNRLVADAKEKQRGFLEKAVDFSTKLLVSGIHTAEKVLEAGSFKPFMDSIVDMTAGRVSSIITGSPYVSLKDVKKGFKTFSAFKTKADALKNIEKLKLKKEDALLNLEKANSSGNENEIKKAEKEFKNADYEYAVSTLYESIESNVLTSFWDYLAHGATDYDVSIGKSTKKDISEYRGVLAKTGYVLDGWIRMHSAMKSSLSARPEMMRIFSATLKDFQKKGKELNAENINTAMVIAADAYEQGRLTNKTTLSKFFSRIKGSEKSVVSRIVGKTIFPVSTIAVSLAKRGIDYSTIGAEGFVRLANETKKGMKLNEAEGKTYDSLLKSIKGGWNRIPLQERVYINRVISRGLFGAGIMLATAYGLRSGNIKYGGTYDDQKKRKIIGSDGKPLEANEWEFFGKRIPKAASLFLNHLPEFLPMALIVNGYQISELDGKGSDIFDTSIQEIEARLPFQTLVGLLVAGKRIQTLVDRFTKVPIAADIAGMVDEKSKERDKSDILNRIRGNIGLGAFNPTKQEMKIINFIDKIDKQKTISYDGKDIELNDEQKQYYKSKFNDIYERKMKGAQKEKDYINGDENVKNEYLKISLEQAKSEATNNLIDRDYQKIYKIQQKPEYKEKNKISEQLDKY